VEFSRHSSCKTPELKMKYHTAICADHTRVADTCFENRAGRPANIRGCCRCLRLKANDSFTGVAHCTATQPHSVLSHPEDWCFCCVRYYLMHQMSCMALLTTIPVLCDGGRDRTLSQRPATGKWPSAILDRFVLLNQASKDHIVKIPRPSFQRGPDHRCD